MSIPPQIKPVNTAPHTNSSSRDDDHIRRVPGPLTRRLGLAKRDLGPTSGIGADGLLKGQCFEGKPVGFTLFFPRYSTWQGRHGIYVEDIFVDESTRGTGIGRKIIAAVAKIAKARGASRIDLSVLKWNPARNF